MQYFQGKYKIIVFLMIILFLILKFILIVLLYFDRFMGYEIIILSCRNCRNLRGVCGGWGWLVTIIWRLGRVFCRFLLSLLTGFLGLIRWRFCFWRFGISLCRMCRISLFIRISNPKTMVISTHNYAQQFQQKYRKKNAWPPYPD